VPASDSTQEKFESLRIFRNFTVVTFPTRIMSLTPKLCVSSVVEICVLSPVFSLTHTQRTQRNARKIARVLFYATQRPKLGSQEKEKMLCFNLKKATQDVGNGMAGICHVIQDNGGGVRYLSHSMS